MRSGETADSIAVNEVIKDLKGLYPAQDEENEAHMLQLYGAMVEAVVNVVRHAYPQNVEWEHQHINRWWMTGAVDKNKRWMTAVVFDQGVSIPVSLPKWERYAGLLRRLSARMGIVPAANDPKSDGYAIAAAVEEAVSSTEESHRGKGFAQMREFLENCREGHLRIMSRFGEVVLYPNGEPAIRSHSAPVGGTLIEWSVVL